MAAIQVNIRVPEVLLGRIKSASGDDRTKWILEACRMRLDNPVLGAESKASVSDGEKMTTRPAADDDSQVQDRTGVANTPTGVKPNMEALRDICAGKAVELPVSHCSSDPLGADSEGENQNRHEIPICGKTWWEDGEQYECLMDAGHREAVLGKHGLRGTAHRLDP